MVSLLAWSFGVAETKIMLTKNEPADGDGSSAEPKAVLLSSAVHRPSKPKTHSMTDSWLIFKY